MIRATANLDAGGCLLRFRASGHAEAGNQGYALVCAAFSILARTAYRAFEALPGVEVRGSSPEPGSLSFELLKPGTNTERAVGIGDFLITGLGDLARDYPDSVVFVLERDWRG